MGIHTVYLYFTSDVLVACIGSEPLAIKSTNQINMKIHGVCVLSVGMLFYIRCCY